jgi:hypothetical protein
LGSCRIIQSNFFNRYNQITKMSKQKFISFGLVKEDLTYRARLKTSGSWLSFKLPYPTWQNFFSVSWLFDLNFSSSRHWNEVKNIDINKTSKNIYLQSKFD